MERITADKIRKLTIDKHFSAVYNKLGFCAREDARQMTIAEIAKLAGTSRGTVDRVINGRGKVNKELEERIKEIIRENDYEVNGSARALSMSQKKYAVGVVINSIGNPFFARVKQGFQDSLKRWENFGLEIVYKEIRGYNEEEQLAAIDEMAAHGVNVLALTPINTPRIIEKLNSLTLPIVTFNNDLHLDKKFAYVGCNYVESGNMCGDLAAMMLSGGEKVAIVTGSLNTLGHRERVECFSSRIAKMHCDIAIYENNDDDSLSYDIVKKVLCDFSPDLIFFSAGGTTGGLAAVEESGKSVRVLAVDETKAVVDGMKNGLVAAAVTQQPYEQGRMAIDLIAQYLYSRKLPRHKHNFTKNLVVLPSMLH